MYDVLIIGSGPSGLTAAIYATRAGLKTLVIAGVPWGGQLQLTTEVENFPGFPEGILGPELMNNMRKQAEKFGTEFVDAAMDPTDFSTQKGTFTVSADGKTYQGRAVLIATGADAKTIGVDGEKELTGHGISYCATCDGAFFRNKNIIVVGGGDSAMEEALFLTNFASSVTIVHRRDEFKASQIMLERARKHPKIKILTNKQIVKVEGQGKVEGVVLKDTVSGGEEPMAIDGIFVAIGHQPNSKVFQGVTVSETGYVQAVHGTNTNIEGVFVAGDVQDDHYRQAITAAGFGAMAAIDIEKWLRK